MMSKSVTVMEFASGITKLVVLEDLFCQFLSVSIETRVIVEILYCNRMEGFLLKGLVGIRYDQVDDDMLFQGR